MGVVLIIVGIVLIIASGRITGSLMRERLPLERLSRHEQADMMEASAGQGVVPGWVSCLNLLGWALGVIGVVILIAS